MAIKTSTFSGWRLSGKDAETFLKQVDESRQNPLAQATFARGQELAKEYLDKGCVHIRPKKIQVFQKG